jgi:hypothetical protein
MKCIVCGVIHSAVHFPGLKYMIRSDPDPSEQEFILFRAASAV